MDVYHEAYIKYMVDSGVKCEKNNLFHVYNCLHYYFI